MSFSALNLAVLLKWEMNVKMEAKMVILMVFVRL